MSAAFIIPSLTEVYRNAARRGGSQEKTLELSTFPADWFRLFDVNKTGLHCYNLLCSSQCSSGYMIWIRNMKLLVCSCLVCFYTDALELLIIVGIHCRRKATFWEVAVSSLWLLPLLRLIFPSKQQPEDEMKGLAHRPCNCNTAAIVA